MADWMLYGATGFTGQLIAEEAVRRGHRPLLAGRSAKKLEPLAQRLNLEWVELRLDQAGALARALGRRRAVIHAAGPFAETAEPMVRACLAAGTHYLDITGELAVLQAHLAREAEVRARGLTLLPAVGFDVVPTDCLARRLADRLPSATSLELAFAAGRASAGTARSALTGLPRGVWVRRAGQLVPWPLGKGIQRVTFLDRERAVMPIPWGDLATAYRTTGIGDIMTSMSIPDKWARVLQPGWRVVGAAWPLVRRAVATPAFQRAAGRWIDSHVKGPAAEGQVSARSQVWGRVTDAAGRSAEAWLETTEAYHLTAATAVRALEAVMELPPQGVTTPALALGADFIERIEGTRIVDG